MKTAKRTLAVVLALLMAFGMFSLVGSAKMNATTTIPELWEGAGTITYGLDVYKVDGDSYTKLENGSYLQPGDVIEVRESFGTNFITYQVASLIFFDSTYFVPAKDGAAYTAADSKAFDSGFFKTYEGDVPEGDLADGSGTATFYDTLGDKTGKATAGVNMYAKNKNSYMPGYMRTTYVEGGDLPAASAAIASEYSTLRYVYNTLTGAADSSTGGGFLSSVPYATYFSFQLKVVDNADSNGETTSIFVPAKAQKTKSNDAINKLFGGTSSGPAYTGSTKTQWGQGIDVTNGEVELIIGNPPHTHTWDEGTVTTPPTCTENGVKTFTCTDCSETKTEPVAALGHDYQAVVTAPTCEEGGYTTYTCSRCPASYTGDETPAIGHDWDDGVVTTEPTCGEAGVKTYTCKNDPTHTYTEPVPATGNHNWDGGTVTREPTCRDGEKTYTCLTCGTTKTEPIPGTGEHQYNEEVTAEPTCLTAGVKTLTCSNCGDTKTEPIPALGHDWDMSNLADDVELSEDYSLATLTMHCKRDVSHSYSTTVDTTVSEIGDATCTLGGSIRVSYSFEDTDIGLDFQNSIVINTPALGHDYKGVVTEPTCTAGGFTTYTCSRCTDSYVDDETPALGHDYKGVVTEPTCTTGGFTTYTCSRCADSYVDDETAALGHDYKDVVTEPTCTAGGFTTHTCSRCNDSYVDTETAALGHDYKDVVTEPTCTAGGFTTHTCSRCNDSYVDTETAALGHAYDAVKTEPTCTAGGFTTYTCPRCGSSYVGDETAALGHDWDDGVVTKEPTEKEEGVKTYTCNRCGETKTESIPKLPATELILTESASGTEGTTLRVTVPYGRKGQIALKLTASEEEVTYTSSNTKLLTVDAEGNVRFARLSLFTKTATITAKTADGKEASCEVTVQLQWWQYLVFLIFGSLWF